MPEFHLDTSGKVDIHGRRSTPNPAEFTAWNHLDAFTQGYIEALFFTETEPSLSRHEDGFCAAFGDEDERDDETAEDEYWSRVREGQIKEIPGDYGFSDLAPETLAAIIKDCADFQRRAERLLLLAYERDYDEAQAGRDFLYTRNGHGVGYWERSELGANEEWGALGRPRVDEPGWAEFVKARENSLGDQLTTAAKVFGNLDASLGDDGKVQLS